ncbi:FxsC protein [Actinoplanes sp. NPDC026619]|uniref:FxsC protein n=1 Tax=Actinoplanes sp. NPDC026619 TaxID=3155798 RepID=UPI003403C03A
MSAASSDHGADLSFLGTAGNRDTSFPPDMLLRLASCDVFVALTSPRYFRNATCGRQWEVFARRFGPGDDRSAMIPVAWSMDAVVPDFVGVPLAAPPRDAPRGLRRLIRLRGHRSEYESFLDDLTQRIVAVGEAAPAPAADPVADFYAVPDAFLSSTVDLRVHLIVAAASREEMDRVRKDLAYYGAEARDWAPYLPEVPGSLASRARLLAADQALQGEVAALDDVLDRIERARVSHEIVVILCDWWLTQLDAYRNILAEIDRRGLGEAVVLIPANRTDRESMENLAELRFGLRTTFKQSWRQSQALLHRDIGTGEAFDADLAGVLEEARNRLFRTSGPRPGGDETMIERPILHGP